MDRPKMEKLELINEFRLHLSAKNYEFTEHNQGYHFRVKKGNAWYNVYPTSGRILSNDNLNKIKTNVKDFF